MEAVKLISRTETNGKFEQWLDLTTELNELVHGAAQEGKPIHEVEREIWQRLLQSRCARQC